jgi:hypothetical protein
MPVQDYIARAITDGLLPAGSEADDESQDWSTWSPGRSTAIELVKHRLKDGQMTVRFANRHTHPDYLFINVPRELFRQWKRVKSAGAFYHRRIKGSYGVA